MSRDALLELVEAAETFAAKLRVLADGAGGEARTGEDAPDLTVAEVCVHLRRSASTIRGWLEAGTLHGYKLPGDAKHAAWRIPPAALAAFKTSTTAPLHIDAYRKHLRRDLA